MHERIHLALLWRGYVYSRSEGLRDVCVRGSVFVLVIVRE